MSYAADTICPFCTTHHRLATAVSEIGEHAPPEPPHDDNFTLCLRCGRWSVFDRHAEGGLRKPTPSEMGGLIHDLAAQQLMTAWLTVVEPGGTS